MKNRVGTRDNERAAVKAVKSVLFASAAALAVQAAVLPQPALAQSYTFTEVSIEGSQRIEPATILSYAGIARGQTVTAAELNDAYQRILASGLFEEVEIVPVGNKLVIRVVEYPTINRVVFEGNRRIKDEDLAGLVTSESRRVFNPATAERDAGIIVQAYAEQGRAAARVTPKLIRRSDNRVDLAFEILEGGVIEVERVSIVGNNVYSDRRLRRVLGTKQAGLFRAIIRRDSFVEDRIEFDKQVLTDFYQSRGYVDFRINSVNAEIAEERDGYFVTFNVQEGQQFTFGEVTATSDLADVDPAEFAEILRVRPGVVYSPALVENEIARMERLANRRGLNFIRVEPRITRNDRTLELDVEFVLSRGPRIFIERIDIEGNTTTLDRVIRRQFKVVEGDPFNPREIRQSAERIRALGFFGNADVNAREGSTPQQVIVDVDVEEAPTGSIGFGGTYSTDGGFGLNLSFNERNFLGRGQALGVELSTASGTRSYGFTFAEPAFLNRDLRFGIGLNYSETDNQYDDSYDTAIGRFTTSLTFPVAEYSTLQGRYTARYSEMLNAGSDLGDILTAEVDQGALFSSGLGYTYTFDTIDTGLDPTAGVRLQFSQDFAGLGGDVTSVTTVARAVGQKKVRNEEVTLRAVVEGGALWTGSNDSRVIDRFNLGSSRMRGFEPGGIGPREIGSGGVNDALGGNYFAVARFEAEFPLGLPEEYGLTGGLFYDVGSLWGLDNTSTTTAGNSVVQDDPAARHVIGASLFWTTAIGPLRFNFTKALQKEEHDEDRFFEFTLATDF
ncbi:MULTISPECIES: outer membrane protein assembly factor BamA [Marinovum]|uniref:outer membrane protein assembly factor BamA n=1 Tax=Marinovum TaxID=367771 RepID=UPI00237AC3AE|nr:MULTISPECIES: outer membrane protein assembly factor BamA [Marinovum]MDD9740803.1 outer membrane protein assembly factor BamA [Marinovum sp. SP66]